MTKAMPGILVAVIATMFSTAIAQSGTSDYTVSLTGLNNNKALDMVYVKGGTFQRGCSTGDTQCEDTEKPAHNITLSDYYISKYEITNAHWRAVMGDNTTNNNNNPKTSITWYDAVEFTCKLSTQTGKKYRLVTDAEFEFAARGGTKSNGYLYSGSNTANDVAWNDSNTPETCYGSYCFSSAQDVGTKKANELGIHDMSGNVYEWTYDNWGNYNSSLDGLIDYTTVHTHMQKVRRGGSYDQPASESRVSARKIRSIDGKDGSIGFRLALSVSDSYPPNMKNPCDIHQPHITGSKEGFRDERLITGSDEAWVYENDYVPGMAYVLKVWENGTAKYTTLYNGSESTYGGATVSGEWYTLNGFSLNIVPTSGSAKKYVYVLLGNDDGINNMTMMSDGDMPGRYVRMTDTDYPGISKITAPNINNPKTLEQLVPIGYNIDMSAPPTDGRDSRLIEGTSYAWWQNNAGYGGTHHYRFDFDTQDNTRFVVYDTGAGTSTLLATGEWFTVDDTFLRIIDNNGCNYDYLYTITTNGNTYYHISYQSYEPGDSRTFAKTAANNVTGWIEPSANATTHNQGCSTFIPASDDNQYTIRPSSSSLNDAGSSSSNGESSSSVETTYVLPQIAMSNQVVQVKNGINLHAINGATVEIYGIRGNLINRQNYASGIYSVSFAHLPKGMYIVKVRFGSSSKILRMPVIF